MKPYKVIELHKSIYENNDAKAAELREELKQKHTLLVNMMSSPGSGKTSVLLRTIEKLGRNFKIGVMEADIASEVDAERITRSGARAIQLHTDGMCHLDAGMTRQGLEAIGTDQLDIVFLENIGNLVCPAEFDTGAAKNVMILSVPEGDDKALKYPLMFTVCDVLLINKMDVTEYFDFNLNKCIAAARQCNPNIMIIPVSAKTCEGMDIWYTWLAIQAEAYR